MVGVWCLLFVVCCFLCAVSRLPCVVCCLLCVDCCSLLVDCRLSCGVCCLIVLVYYVCDVPCLLRVVGRLLVARSWPFVVCMMCVGCCVVNVIRCVLFVI